MTDELEAPRCIKSTTGSPLTLKYQKGKMPKRIFAIESV